MLTKVWLLFSLICTNIECIIIDQITPTEITTQTFTLNATYEVVLIYRSIPSLETKNPFRVKTSSNTASEYLPIMVVTHQRAQVSAWQTPLLVETNIKNGLYFKNVSKILCHDFMADIIKDFSTLPLHITQSFIITLSTASARDVDVTLELEEVEDFYVSLDTPYSLTVSPSEPRYVFYKFDTNTSQTIVVEFSSDDEICLTVSIQDSKCPVFDMNKDIKYEGIYQTINRKGAITLRKKDWLGGFFIVFVAKADNFDCSQENSYLPRSMRTVQISPINITSSVHFVIRNGINSEDYKLAVGGTFLVCFGVAVLLGVTALVFNRYGTLSRNKYDDIIVTDYYETYSEEQVQKILHTEELRLSLLAKHPKRIKKRSYNYLSHILSIALFYSIPVVQLVVTYQRTVNQTGNQDMCYYNFLCAHPALGFSDFNHIFSNIGYVICGIIFILVVVDRHRIINMRKDKGIPVHYGLYHAMGVALIIEGLLSACYHICPSQSNYQFDTSFMYIMAVLCMIKLYQNRHPDINATAYTTFTILGAAIFMAVIGILNGSLIIWIFFVICYTTLCIVVSFKIYYLNFVLNGLSQFKDNLLKKGFCSDTFVPVRRARFILLVIANIANYAMLITGLCLYSSNVTDFGTFLLGLLMANSVIHAIFYTSMKLIMKERICFEAIIYGLLGIGSWAASGVFFLDYAILWTVTPAESRQWNQECILLNFYDKHDVWHLLSAPALYFSFMYLMYLDDDIIDKDQNEIPVF